MNSQNNNEDDSMDFSIIDKNEEKHANLDFSVRDLLENQEGQQLPLKQLMQVESPTLPKLRKQSEKQHSSIKKRDHQQQPYRECENNDFLRDLSRMQKQLSFQTQQYCVYNDQPNNSLQMAQNSKSKTLSCLKLTKEYTSKSSSKQIWQDYNYYSGELILDFNKKELQPSKKMKTEIKSSNSQLSIQNSNLSKEKIKENIKSKNSKIFLRPIELNHKQQFKLKSKSKSILKIGLKSSKSQSNIQGNTEGETYPSKVFSQYYGEEINTNCKGTQANKNKQLVRDVKSREKSLKSKLRLTVLSPQVKAAQLATTKSKR